MFVYLTVKLNFIHHFKTITMKKIFFILMPILTLAVLITSCSKSDTSPANNNAPIQGKWVGVFTPPVGPSPYFAITFNNDGSVVVEQNNIAAPDIAQGTWGISGNNISATYTFATGPMMGTYSLAGTYSAAIIHISGTIGTGTSTTGYGTFDVGK